MKLLTGRDRAHYEQALRALGAIDVLREKVALLQEELGRLREMADRERKRAELAVDELLALRGIPPVTPPPEPREVEWKNPFAEDPAQVRKIEEAMQARGVAAVLAEELHA